MTDALFWLLYLLADDIGRLVAGILVLIALVEFVMHFKEWVS